MVGQADIEDIDGWQRQVSTDGDDVERSTEIVRGRRDTIRHAMRSQSVSELDRVRVGWTVHSDVDVADDQYRFDDSNPSVSDVGE